MASNDEDLTNFMVASFLEKNSIRTAVNSFKRNKKISDIPASIANLPKDKLCQIISFYNKKAPVKDRLVMAGASKVVAKPRSSDESDDSDDEAEETPAKSAPGK